MLREYFDKFINILPFLLLGYVLVYVIYSEFTCLSDTTIGSVGIQLKYPRLLG